MSKTGWTRQWSEHMSMLVALGFRRTGRMADVLSYECDPGHMRKLEVQLWSNGSGRVNHVLVRSPNSQWATTEPTNFRTPLQMLAAIDWEWRRVSTPPSLHSGLQEMYS